MSEHKKVILVFDITAQPRNWTNSAKNMDFDFNLARIEKKSIL